MAGYHGEQVGSKNDQLVHDGLATTHNFNEFKLYLCCEGKPSFQVLSVIFYQ